MSFFVARVVLKLLTQKLKMMKKSHKFFEICALKLKKRVNIRFLVRLESGNKTKLKLQL